MSTINTPAEFVAAMNQKFSGGTVSFSMDRPGRKYTRVVSTPNGATHSLSAAWFFDNEGNIYKAASWKAPARGVRFTAVQYDEAIKIADPYGSWLYLR